MALLCTLCIFFFLSRSSLTTKVSAEVLMKSITNCLYTIMLGTERNGAAGRGADGKEIAPFRMPQRYALSLSLILYFFLLNCRVLHPPSRTNIFNVGWWKMGGKWAQHLQTQSSPVVYLACMLPPVEWRNG